jgi:hypothetical protein
MLLLSPAFPFVLHYRLSEESLDGRATFFSRSGGIECRRVLLSDREDTGASLPRGCRGLSVSTGTVIDTVSFVGLVLPCHESTGSTSRIDPEGKSPVS